MRPTFRIMNIEDKAVVRVYHASLLRSEHLGGCSVVAWFLGLCSFCILMSVVSCSTPQAEEQAIDALDIARQMDSLSSAGGHGYFVETYLIGRYKVSRVKKTTFDVEVSRLDKRLVEHPIEFQVLGPRNYQLSYSLGSLETKLVGEFDKVLDAEFLEILVSSPANLDSADFERMIGNFSVFKYELRVYVY
mgnify:CR=1 FL=1